MTKSQAYLCQQNKTQMDATQLNKVIDSQIGEGEVTPDIYRRFLQAYNYESASTMSWLVGKLRIIKVTLAERPVKIESNTTIVLTNEDDFEKWLQTYFPDVQDEIL